MTMAVVDRPNRRSNRAFHTGDPRSAGGRLVVGAVAAIAAMAAMGRAEPSVRVIAGYDVWATVILMLIGHLMLAADGEETRCRAAAADPGRRVAWLVLALGS